jgi:hypothetical protein
LNSGAAQALTCRMKPASRRRGSEDRAIDLIILP